MMNISWRVIRSGREFIGVITAGEDTIRTITCETYAAARRLARMICRALRA